MNFIFIIYIEASSSSSWLSSKLSLDIKQSDTNLQAMANKYDGEYKPWFIERWFETPINYVQDGLEIVHFGLGIPWWATIGLTAIAVRLACYPLLLLNAKQISYVTDTQPILKLIQDEYKRKKTNNDFETRLDEKRWFQNLYNKTTDITGYRLYKLLFYPFSLICSLPPFIFAARAIARRTNHDLDEGGLLWFTNLSAPDMYTILPFVGITFTWCVFSYGAGRWMDGRYTGQFHKYLSYIYFTMCTWPLLMIAVFVDLPAGIYCYWIPFSLFGLFCKITLRNNGFRKRLNIPQLNVNTIKINEPINDKLNKYYYQLLRDFKRMHSYKKKPQTVSSVSSLTKAKKKKALVPH